MNNRDIINILNDIFTRIHDNSGVLESLNTNINDLKAENSLIK